MTDLTMRKTIKIRALIAYNDQGEYIIHGSQDESYEQMAKAIAPIWHFDPSSEVIQHIEFDVSVPNLEMIERPFVTNDTADNS